MKIFKHLILLLLSLSLIFALFACGDKNEECKKHKDEDEDGICDVCKEKTDGGEDGGEDEKTELELIKNGAPLFKIIVGSDVDEATRAEINALSDKLSLQNVSGEELVEILVGTVSSRGEECKIDRLSLGYGGTAMKAVDGKIIITGGSDKALLEAFTEFSEKILGIKPDTEEIPKNVTVKTDKLKIKPQTDYRVSEITVSGNDVKDYVIACDTSDEVYLKAAKTVRDLLWQKAGYYLDIVDLGEAPDGKGTISLIHVEKNKAGATGFRARVVAESFYIECAHRTGLLKALGEYIVTFVQASEKMELKDYSGETDITRIYYSDFGVVGDGKTNDTEAIRAAHEAANLDNLTVMGEKGKTYYFAKMETPIMVKTDVDFCGAKLIFDASYFTKEDTGNVFQVESHYPDTSVAKEYIEAINAKKGSDGLVIRGLSHGDEQTTKLDLGLGYPALLKIYNTKNKTYMRWGYVDNSGQNQCEVVLVDKDGNIDPSTPILLDYTELTSITVIRTDIPTLTIKNATVDSIASKTNTLGKGGSIAHSFYLSRPNTVFENMHHIISGEIAKNAPARLNTETGLWEDVSSEGYAYDTQNGGKYNISLNGSYYDGEDVKPFMGYTYSGFVQCRDAHNILVKGCTFQARVYYNEGTYDISSTFVNKVVFENCVQSNFFDEREVYKQYGPSTVPNLSLCWGVAGTNFCKNMEYINSELTRYDAHCGVVNGKVVGGKIAVVRLIGGGTFTIEDVDFYTRSGASIQLREDYGASFNGTVIVKNTNFKYGWYSQFGHCNYGATLFSAPSAPWDNNYTTHFPNIIIDNISVQTTRTDIILISSSGRDYPASHYPLRNIMVEDVSNPDAPFTIYYETKNAKIVEQKPEKFPYLEGFKKVSKTQADVVAGKLNAGEYTVIDNGDGTYTVIAAGVKNINPYTPPEFIEIRNMQKAINENGVGFKFIIYDCPFLKDTEIKDPDGLVMRQ